MITKKNSEKKRNLLLLTLIVFLYFDPKFSPIILHFLLTYKTLVPLLLEPIDKEQKIFNWYRPIQFLD
jgi:hypothetical protein